MLASIGAECQSVTMETSGGKMSTEEDPELRDLIAKCLENNGVLGKIRAQLRANTFLALDQQDDPKVKFPISNAAIQNYASSKEGHIVLSLIREFLVFFNMQFSLSVFDPESSEAVGHNSLPRNELAACLSLTNLKSEEPVIHALFKSLKTDKTEQVVSNQRKGEMIFNQNPDKSSVVRDSNVNVTLKGVENEYDEDFQSSSSVSEQKNHDIKEASVDEELDISASDLLASQSSNADQDTVDKTTSNSSITGAAHIEKIK